MSINLMERTIQEYKDVTNNLVQVHEGLLVPKSSDFDQGGHKLIIYDDLFEEVCDSDVKILYIFI